MKSLIIAIGLLAFIAASNIPSWAENKPIYVCYLKKNQEVRRYVDNPAKCKSSEIAMAISTSTKNRASDSMDQRSSRKELQQDPTMPFSQILSSGGGSSSSP